MKTTLSALLFVALATGLALEPPSSLGTMTPAARDPRVQALRAEQEAVKNDPARVKALENRIQEIYLETQPALPQDGGGITFITEPWELPQVGDGPDIVLDTGRILATGADYEMNGSMYVAWSRARDSSVRVAKSTDHGNTWQPLFSFRTAPVSPVRRLHLVVGAGDSAFVYVPVLHPDNNGDVTCARALRNGTGLTAFWVSHDTATINNFTFCRDYLSPYYLYCCAGNEDHGPAMDDYILRSTNFAKNWAQTNRFRFVSDGSYQAGAGQYLYVAGHAGFSPYRGHVNLLVNTLYGAPDSWRETGIMPDTFEVRYPVMAPSFYYPPSGATVWVLYSHNFENSGDWDTRYAYSTDAGLTWSPSYYLAGSVSADEWLGDIKPYADPGNTWMNASYISEETYRTVYRHYCEQSNPSSWSDTLRINTTRSAGTGQEVRPLLVYSPGAPGTGAGCVFVGSGLNGLYWNAPWTGTAVSEELSRRTPVGFDVRPNPLTSRAAFRWNGSAQNLTVLDAAGRVVRKFDSPASGLTWDCRDASGTRVAAGIYFAQLLTDAGAATRLLVVE
uniref:T9SS type A sorting domain-containing protein n=1 Tax=candidate division WOR-3 bacterium TaxID=2052148 RepID=A0A7C4CAP9_UNCW3